MCMGGWVDEKMNGWGDGYVDGQVHRLVDGWADGRMDGCMGSGWVGGCRGRMMTQCPEMAA